MKRYLIPLACGLLALPAGVAAQDVGATAPGTSSASPSPAELAQMHQTVALNAWANQLVSIGYLSGVTAGQGAAQPGPGVQFSASMEHPGAVVPAGPDPVHQYFTNGATVTSVGSSRYFTQGATVTSMGSSPLFTHGATALEVGSVPYFSRGAAVTGVGARVVTDRTFATPRGGPSARAVRIAPAEVAAGADVRAGVEAGPSATGEVAPTTEAAGPNTAATAPTTEATRPNTAATAPTTETTRPNTAATPPGTDATAPSTSGNGGAPGRGAGPAPGAR